MLHQMSERERNLIDQTRDSIDRWPISQMNRYAGRHRPRRGDHFTSSVYDLKQLSFDRRGPEEQVYAHKFVEDDVTILVYSNGNVYMKPTECVNASDQEEPDQEDQDDQDDDQDEDDDQDDLELLDQVQLDRTGVLDQEEPQEQQLIDRFTFEPTGGQQQQQPIYNLVDPFQTQELMIDINDRSLNIPDAEVMPSFDEQDDQLIPLGPNGTNIEPINSSTTEKPRNEELKTDKNRIDVTTPEEREQSESTTTPMTATTTEPTSTPITTTITIPTTTAASSSDQNSQNAQNTSLRQRLSSLFGKYLIRSASNKLL